MTRAGEHLGTGGVGAVVEHDCALGRHLHEAARARQQLLRGHDAVRLLPEQPHAPPPGQVRRVWLPAGRLHRPLYCLRQVRSDNRFDYCTILVLVL